MYFDRVPGPDTALQFVAGAVQIGSVCTAVRNHPEASSAYCSCFDKKRSVQK